MGKYLKASAIAAKYDIGLSTVYQMGQNGVCPCVKIGSSVRFPEAEFEAWIREHLRAERQFEPVPAD